MKTELILMILPNFIFLAFWMIQFLELMKMKDTSFPGKNDKNLWFVTFFIGFLIPVVLPTQTGFLILSGNFLGSVLFYFFKPKSKRLHFFQKTELDLKESLKKEIEKRQSSSNAKDYCAQCDTQLTIKDKASNICHGCGRLAQI